MSIQKQRAVKIIEEILLKNELDSIRAVSIDMLVFTKEYSKASYGLYCAHLTEVLKSLGVPKEVVKNWIEEAESKGDKLK